MCHIGLIRKNVVAGVRVGEPKHFVHAWEIEGFVNIDKGLKDDVKAHLLTKYGSYQNATRNMGKITGVSISCFLRNGGAFMRISNLFRLTDVLSLPRETVEKQISVYRDYSTNRLVFRVGFPYEFTPLVLTSIAHIPGDGNIRKDGFSRWIQKDTAYMQGLLRKLLRASTKPYKKQLCIPRFLIKISCLALGIRPEELGSSEFVKAVMSLPRPYKVQALLALIEDEATIDEGYGPIYIRMISKDLVDAYAELCDSLGYERSNVVRIANSGFGRGDTLYKFGILAEGIRNLYKDYANAVRMFGRIGGLWKKDQSFRRRCEKALSNKALNNQEGREITENILKLLSEHRNLSVTEICNLMSIKNYNRIYDRVRYLHKRGMLRRTSYGRYALIKAL